MVFMKNSSCYIYTGFFLQAKTFLSVRVLVYLQMKAESHCNNILVLPVIRLHCFFSLRGGLVGGGGALCLVTNELHNLRNLK